MEWIPQLQKRSQNTFKLYGGHCLTLNSGLALFYNAEGYVLTNMSHFSYSCKKEGENGISRLISETA